MRNILVVVLAFTSGFVDAVVFLRLGVFASVLTGNTILVAIAVDSGNILHVAVLVGQLKTYEYSTPSSLFISFARKLALQ